jgi:hypothetical protein
VNALLLATGAIGGAPKVKGVGWLNVDGLLGAVTGANGFVLTGVGLPNENAVIAFVAEVGVWNANNSPADKGRVSSLCCWPKLKEVLIAGAPKPPKGLLSSGFFWVNGLETDGVGAPNVKGLVVEEVELAVTVTCEPPNDELLPFTPLEPAANENGVAMPLSFPFNCMSLDGLSSILTSWSRLLGGVTGLWISDCCCALGTPKVKGGLFVTSVPTLPPLKLKATGGAAVPDAGSVATPDVGAVCPNVKIEVVGSLDSIVVEVPAPNEKGEESLASSGSFSWRNEKVPPPNRGFGTDTSAVVGRAGAVVDVAEDVALLIDDPKVKGLGTSPGAESTTLGATEAGTFAPGPKENGSGDGVDCGGVAAATENGLDFWASPNNPVDVGLAARPNKPPAPVPAPVFAALGSPNIGFGEEMISGFLVWEVSPNEKGDPVGAPTSPEFDGLSSVRSPNNVLFVLGVTFSAVAWSPKGKDVDAMVDLSPTDAVGLPNEDDICVDDGLSSAGFPKENEADVGAASVLCFSTLSGNNDIPDPDLLSSLSSAELTLGGTPREFVLVGASEGLLDDKPDGAGMILSFNTLELAKKLGTVIVFGAGGADAGETDTGSWTEVIVCFDSKLKNDGALPEVFPCDCTASAVLKKGTAGTVSVADCACTTEGVGRGDGDDFEKENGRDLIGGSFAFSKSSKLGTGAGVLH